MLTENEIVDAVCKRLSEAGYRIDSRAATHQRGVDIVASRRRTKLFVEAKGDTTSRQSSRAGYPFDRKQCGTHVSVALFTAARLVQEGLEAGERRQVAIALPDNERHRGLVREIRWALVRLRVAVIWVDEAKIVRCPGRLILR